MFVYIVYIISSINSWQLVFVILKIWCKIKFFLFLFLFLFLKLQYDASERWTRPQF